MHDLNLKLIKVNKKILWKIKISVTLVLTSSLFTAVHRSLLYGNEEKLVAAIVYSAFVQVATSVFRIIPYSLVVVVVYDQLRSESGITPYSPQHCSTA